MNGSQGNFKYYFAIIDDNPYIVQRIDGRDVTHASLKSLTDLATKNNYPANMIVASELALNNTRINMYLIMMD
jgi:hypothetical protein